VAGGYVFASACDVRVAVKGDYHIGVNEVLVGVGFPSIAYELCRAKLTPPTLWESFSTGKFYKPGEALQKVIHFVSFLWSQNEWNSFWFRKYLEWNHLPKIMQLKNEWVLNLTRNQVITISCSKVHRSRSEFNEILMKILILKKLKNSIAAIDRQTGWTEGVDKKSSGRGNCSSFGLHWGVCGYQTQLTATCDREVEAE
jgi:hypothetical protein